jgi:RNA polymerase sigma-70 factor (ECF subfamily)
LNQETLTNDYKREAAADDVRLASVDDRELIRLVAAHSHAAFAELYQRFSGPLFNFLLSLVSDQHAAEDLLQEVFLAVWKGAWRYRGAAAVKTWLFNITYKQGISHLRRRKDVLVDDLDQIAVAPGSPGLSGDPIQSRMIIRAVEQLTPQHRAALELVLYYQMSYQEAADVLACPVGTVKSRVSYARHQLKALISAMGLTAED